jgi:hypothetical protein
MLATHQEILRNVHCHRGGAKSAAAAGAAAGAATQRVFPSYAAPPGFAKRSEGGAGGAGGALAYDGANGAEIAFDAGLSGRSDIVSESVTPDVIAKLLTNAGILQRVEGAPALTTVNDMQGHQRRIWSVAGIGRSRDAVQMEVMIWYCDRRNMTFIGRYATPGRHEVRNGINALLPAACHSE